MNGMISGMFSSGATLSVCIVVYAKERGEFDVAFAIGAILMILTLIVNFAAEAVGKIVHWRKNR